MTAKQEDKKPERFVDAVLKGDNVEASKHLEELVRQKCAKWIKAVLGE